ncbi:MAG: cupin domain-containing protein [Thermomicrobiales bacterium]
MARTGQVIINPLTGERITFLKTARETRGKLLRFDCRAPSRGARLPAHIHETAEERFAVLSGALGVMRGGRAYVLHAGQGIVVPATVKHQWWNAGDEAVHFRVEIRPPHGFEAALEMACDLARHGKMTRGCIPKNPFDLAYLGRLSESYLPTVPVIVQKSALAAIASVGWLLGYEPEAVTDHMHARHRASTLAVS